MAKKKESSLLSWDEVDNRLRRLGELQIQKSKLEGNLQTKINELKADYTTQSTIIANEAKQIETDITRFCDAHKDEFLNKRNKKLNFGVVAYRLSEKVIFSSVDAVIKSIKALNLEFVLRIKEEIDKEKIKSLDKHTLTKIGVKIETKDKISIEPDIVKLAAEIN